MSKVKHSRFNCNPGCSVEAAIGLLDGKWKSLIFMEFTYRKNITF